MDDPSNDLPEEEARVERDRLFDILEDLVKWENSNDENVLGRARKEILRSTGGNPPPVLDPFCGGGSIPLEAQRLGPEAHGSDLNPKALIEIPPKFAGQPPVNPESRAKIGNEGNWRGAQGLAEDVRIYGKWMRDEAEKRIGHLYPKGPNGETVIAWLWARTVRCPNPACGATMPLVSTFWLSKKQGKKAWIEPVVDREKKEVRFTVKKCDGLPPDPPKVGRGAKIRCLVCEQVVEDQYIKHEGKAGQMEQQLIAVIAEGPRRRLYFEPDDVRVPNVNQAELGWRPEEDLSTHPQYMAPPRYGMAVYADVFTSRQLMALTTFSDLVDEARERAQRDAVTADLSSDGAPFNNGGRGAQAYADAVATYLAFAVDKGANYWSTLCGWHSGRDAIMSTFARQVYPMTWDFVEANPFSASSGNFVSGVEQAAAMIERVPATVAGTSKQSDAADGLNGATRSPLISTDPPYYDNVPYADLSDFFYIWLRHSVGRVYPDLFGTLLSPKSPELVADQRRHGGRGNAQKFFEEGLYQAFVRERREANPDYPVTVYYAFRQSETVENENGARGIASTGWETMLEGLMAAGFQITGTWPMRTELTGNLKKNMNALASSIVLVCRPRPAEAAPATRQEFVRTLRRELPDALSVMMSENVAPVDLAQATIGPGMAIYSRYSKVVEADSSPMGVRTRRSR